MADFNLEHLKQFRLKPLFVDDLGWDRPAQQQPYTIAVGEDTFELDVVAHKRGVQVLHCRPDAQGHVPPYATRQKIERKVTAEAREHLIVFTDTAQTTQVWQWVARLAGKPVQYREVYFRHGESAELLKQKLSRLRFTLDEEELLTVLGVARRLEDAIPRDRVTKRFYTEFKAQRDAFEPFIDGIPPLNDDLRWYASVLINRLMFIWFLQEKEFLDDNKSYLQQRLATHTTAAPTQSFYKNFLCPLFFRGFATERTEANQQQIVTEFGRVPYLNGGLFSQHELEQRYGDALDVADAALQRLFAFFDEWDWHLDDRPLKNDREINPDVLGYIFEKFVNQKQMGAYYTKEDITEYIGKNTIIPALLHKVRSKHVGAFDALAWPLLQAEPDRYFYPAMLKGVDTPYPVAIDLGRNTEAPELLARRKAWNGKTPDAWALPTEIWRETIARHDRTREVRAKLAAGEVREIGDLITYNLDIRRFAQDVIERCTDAALLREFWAVLAGRAPRKAGEKFRPALSVLDPTCGSGAFLFAALNILKPLYDAALGTMAGLLLDADLAGGKHSPEKWKDIEETVERFAALRGDRARDYAVIKHIVVHNLYGVDIEEQATEIAKLRLFLKLVSLLEPGDTIEPLPDIDFNIRHGNTLVGYATAEETEAAVRGATQSNLFSDAWEDIRLRLMAVEEAHQNFQIQQVQRGGHVTAQDKQALAAQLSELEEMLNFHLCRAYGKDPTKAKQYDAWKASHKPFHWYVDFYPLMAAGGFDAVVGNPPYIEYAKVRSEYSVLEAVVDVAAGNLYAMITERCRLLSAVSMGLIVPVSIVSTQRMRKLQSTLGHRTQAWYSNYAERPSKLFAGAEVLLTIVLTYYGGEEAATRVTGLRKWSVSQRQALFDTTTYVTAGGTPRPFVVPKLSAPVENSATSRLWSQRERLGKSIVKSGRHKLFYRIGGGRYWKVFTTRSPKFSINGVPTSSSRENTLSFNSATLLEATCAVLSSSIFFWNFSITTNGRDLNPIDLTDFPINVGSLPAETQLLLAGLGRALMAEYDGSSKMRTKESKQTGVVEYEEFYPRLSKSRIDEIDTLLAQQIGLTSEELDFIVNYDVKYRMGQDADVSDD